MDYTNYGENRWELCCGEYSGVEKEAINRLYGLVQSYVPYILTLRMMSGKILLDSNNKKPRCGRNVAEQPFAERTGG